MFVPFRCVPVPENETCGNIVESYAIDVAQVELNIAIVNATEIAISLTLANETDVDPTCITIANWIICVFRFPPCIGTKLILPCIEACEEILRFLAACFFIVDQYVHDYAVIDHFTGYRCRLPESYYVGYDRNYYVFDHVNQCINVSNNLDG